MKISSSTTLAPERYTRDEPNAPIIEIATDGVELDLGGAVFDGENRTSVGILVHDCERVTIRNGVVRGFHWGMLAENVKQLRIERCVVSGNHNPPGLGWLGDDVVPVEEGFGGGIRLVRATDCVLDGNIVHDNLNGIDLVRTSSRFWANQAHNGSFWTKLSVYNLPILTPNNSNARCWSGVGSVSKSNAARWSPPLGITRFLTNVPKLARRVRKLCTGNPSAVR